VPELTAADRVTALLEWGDIAEADAEIDEAADGPGAWQACLWRAARALMEGRFLACERMADDAAERGEEEGEPRAGVLATLLVAALRREQERVAEGERLLRALLHQYPSAPGGAHALLALLVGEMGRDGQARQELSRLVPRDPVPATGKLGTFWVLAELAASVGAPKDELLVLVRRLGPHARDFAVEEGGAVFWGSVAFALGRLAQAAGRADEAIVRYDEAIEAHERVGAPLLLAHTQRHLASLLRTRGADGDWERAVDLQSSAATIYRHLGVDGLAAQAQAVLARSDEWIGHNGRHVFRRQGDVWTIGGTDDLVRLRDSKGLRDIARLLAAPRRAIHVADLLLGAEDAGRRVPGDQTAAPGGLHAWAFPAPVVDDDTRREYQARLNELAAEVVEAERTGNRVRAALARAEREALSAALEEGEGGDFFDVARRTVGTRIRITLDRIEQAEPSVGRHLRLAIRTGTFCSYEPEELVRWAL
jgi:tetratricopeptide (TPR) repeat protein